MYNILQDPCRADTIVAVLYSFCHLIFRNLFIYCNTLALVC